MTWFDFFKFVFVHLFFLIQICFVGDCGSYLTNNYFPSPLHRASPSRMAGQNKTRISTPFFLRGPYSCVMKPSEAAPPSQLPPMTVEQLDNNVAGCRDKMPWKLGDYYAEMKYS